MRGSKAFWLSGRPLAKAASDDFDYLFDDSPTGRDLFSLSAWVFRLVTLRAQAVAGVPLYVVDEGTGERVEDHPLAEALGRGNSGLMFRVEAALQLWGEAYLEIVRDRMFRRGRGLHWVNPSSIRPVIDRGEIVGFEQVVMGGATFAPEDIVYMHYFNPKDDLRGLSPLTVAAGKAEVSEAIMGYARAFFENGARIDGILNIPGASDEQVDLLEVKWKAVFRGVRNAFRTLVMGAQKVEYQQVSAAPKDLAMKELREETRRDLCAIFGVPPAIAGAWEAANYASSAEQRESFYTETVLPELDFILDELNRQVGDVWPGVRVEFDTSGIEALSQHEVRRNEAISTAVNGSWLTLNEARERVGLPPLAQDGVIIGGQLVPVETAAMEDEAPEPAAETEGKAADAGRVEPFHPFYEQAGARGTLALLERRLRRRLLTWWEGATRRLFGEGKAESPGGDALGRLDGEEWLDRDGLLEEVTSVQAEAAKRGVKGAGVALDMELSWDLVQEEVLEWSRQYSGALITRITEDVREKVRAIIVEGLREGTPWMEVKKRIVEEGFPEYRAEMIARTEVIRAFTQGAVAGYTASGVVVGLRWLDGQPGACKLCSALDGKVVRLGEGFYAGGDGLPPRHPNCRCAVAPVTRAEAEEMGEPMRSYLLASP